MTGIESKAQEYVANLEEVRTEVFTEVTSNIQNAQAKQKLYYDFKHARAGFQITSFLTFNLQGQVLRVGPNFQHLS